MTFALLMILCTSQGTACRPVLIEDGFVTQAACQMQSQISAAQQHGLVKRIVCAPSSLVPDLLGKNQA